MEICGVKWTAFGPFGDPHFDHECCLYPGHSGEYHICVCGALASQWVTENVPPDEEEERLRLREYLQQQQKEN